MSNLLVTVKKVMKVKNLPILIILLSLINITTEFVTLIMDDEVNYCSFYYFTDVPDAIFQMELLLYRLKVFDINSKYIKVYYLINIYLLTCFLFSAFVINSTRIRFICVMRIKTYSNYYINIVIYIFIIFTLFLTIIFLVYYLKNIYDFKKLSNNAGYNNNFYTLKLTVIDIVINSFNDTLLSIETIFEINSLIFYNSLFITNLIGNLSSIIICSIIFKKMYISGN